jgi:hypothetical protein
VEGEKGEQFGRTELGRRLVETVKLALQWMAEAPEKQRGAFVPCKPNPTARDLAILFATDRTPSKFTVKMSPPPLESLRWFFLQHGRNADDVTIDDLEHRFERVLQKHRIETDEGRSEAAAEIVRAACRAAGMSRYQARALFEASKKAQRRRDRGTTSEVSPAS